MRLLFIRFSAIGDIVLASPALRCAKQQIPGVEIHFLTKKSMKAVETVIKGVRIYLTEYRTVEDYITKTNLFESDADTLLHNLKVKIFDEELNRSLCERIVLNKFANELAELSDIAEKIASKLSVFRFKRSI